MRTIRKYRKGGGTSEIFSRLIEINNELKMLNDYIKSGHVKDISAGKRKIKK